MSFLAVLKGIFHDAGVVLQVAQPLEPLVNAIPGVGPAAVLVWNAIIQVEKLVPQSGAGVAKKTAVQALVTAAYPKVDQAKLGSVIDTIVSSLNALGVIGQSLGSAT